MNRYTIYCTEAQTRRAMELGAPIESDISTVLNHYFDEKRGWIKIPTAEQVIGWLEEQGGIDEINISKNWDEDEVYAWSFDFYDKEFESIGHGGSYNSRKEATLAAIDAALEYLTNKK